MKTRVFTDQQKIDIVQMYQENEELTCEDIARKYNVYRNAINKILRVRGVKIRNDRCKLRRKYKLNENYFENINCEEKAYFLGFLYADGNNFTKKSTISICLQDRDADILKKFKHSISSDAPICKIFRSKKNKNWQDVQKIVINCNKMSNDLNNLGCFNKKSFTINFPNKQQVPEYLICPFIRGYFDGDGSISISKTGRPNLNIVSTVMFIEEMSKILKNKLDINGFIYQDKRTIGKTTRQFYITKKEDMKKFLEWIYKDATIYLDRKHQKYMEVKNLCFS